MSLVREIAQLVEATSTVTRLSRQLQATCYDLWGSGGGGTADAFRFRASATSWRWTGISGGASIPIRTLSPRTSTMVITMLSPMTIRSSLLRDSTNMPAPTPSPAYGTQTISRLNFTCYQRQVKASGFSAIPFLRRGSQAANARMGREVRIRCFVVTTYVVFIASPTVRETQLYFLRHLELDTLTHADPACVGHFRADNDSRFA